ncbi:hypothetical protein [Hymenobacter tenuis]
MKHPMQYRYIRMWYRRRRPLLRKRGGFCFCHLGGGVVVLGYAGKLTGVSRAQQ